MQASPDDTETTTLKRSRPDDDGEDEQDMSPPEAKRRKLLPTPREPVVVVNYAVEDGFITTQVVPVAYLESTKTIAIDCDNNIARERQTCTLMELIKEDAVDPERSAYGQDYLYLPSELDQPIYRDDKGIATQEFRSVARTRFPGTLAAGAIAFDTVNCGPHCIDMRTLGEYYEVVSIYTIYTWW